MVERDDRSSLATFHHAGVLRAGATVALGDEVVQHVRVRRLAVGSAIGLVNGAGTRAVGRIVRMGKRDVVVAIDGAEPVAKPAPLRLCVPVADRERMLWLGEKAVEIGVSEWQPVVFHRSRGVSPRGEGAAFDRKLAARMRGALEQSGGAWLPSIRPPRSVEDHLRAPPSVASRILLDAGGAPLVDHPLVASAEIVVGPEGGLTPAERCAFADAGWTLASLGASTLRFETAAIVAAGILRSRSRPAASGDEG